MSFRTIRWTPLAVLALCLPGCGGDNPGKWPIDQVEALIMEREQLTEATLAADGPGQLTGTGTDAQGETFQLTVTQDADAKEIRWEAKGNRGATATGLYGH